MLFGLRQGSAATGVGLALLCGCAGRVHSTAPARGSAAATSLASAPATHSATGSAGSVSASPTPALPGTDLAWPRYTLVADHIWQMNLPQGKRFDASGLVELPAGELLTVSDRGPTLYRIEFGTNQNAVNLVSLPDCFTEAQLAPFAKEKIGRYDCEGVARDDQGRLYLCEESNRWILRWDPLTKKVEQLPIDWAPVRRYFDPSDLNASFEGIAIGGDKLYVANERHRGRLIVVDLATLKVLDDFLARPWGSTAKDVHYSDLSWFDGALYALLRENRMVLKIDPATHRVLAQYDYNQMENAPDVAYLTRLFAGVMEGLAVDREFFYLCTDNNGFGRWRHPWDTRPTLFRCRRPDR